MSLWQYYNNKRYITKSQYSRYLYNRTYTEDDWLMNSSGNEQIG